jgi:hypothetical protein
MSQDNKPTPSSSLSSLSKPLSSPPVSPQLSSVRTSKTTSIIDSASNMNNAIEQRLNAFEVAQQKSATDINRLTSMMEMLIRSQSTMTTKVDDRINNNDTESQQQVVQSLNKQTTVDNSTTTQSRNLFKMKLYQIVMQVKIEYLMHQNRYLVYHLINMKQSNHIRIQKHII